MQRTQEIEFHCARLRIDPVWLPGKNTVMSDRIAVSVILLFLLPTPVRGQEEKPDPTIVLAEGERFLTNKSDWTVCSQSDSYADQTFGGMWSTHGGLLRAPAESANSTAVQTVKIPEAGKYRVWSKYQCPPYFHYMHRVEVWQRGRRLFSHDYGKLTAKRLYSFFGKTTYGLPAKSQVCLLYTSPSPRDATLSRMPSSA